MSVYIDINCDMGESYGRWTLGRDEDVMPHITSANIACGFHGGDPSLILMVMAMTKYDAEARKTKARVAAEGFADRVYADDGQLVSRRLGKDALVSDPSKAADQAVRMAMEQKVTTISGKTIAAKVDTICIHGDSPGAEKIVAAVRDGLVKAGATVKPLREWFKG